VGHGQPRGNLAEAGEVSGLDPLFLDTEDILELHEKQIDAYGGSLGIREPFWVT